MPDAERNVNPLVEESLLADCDQRTNYDEQSSVRNIWRDLSEKDILQELKELEDE